MSEELARNYATDYANQVREWQRNGTPFGAWEDDDDIHDTDEPTVVDYLESAMLDCEYTVSSDGTYRSARILIGFGGPNVWINTRTGDLEVSWYSDVVTEWLPIDFITEIDEFMSELWESR